MNRDDFIRSFRVIGAGHIVGIGIVTVVAMICTGRVIAVFNHFLKKKIEMSVM